LRCARRARAFDGCPQAAFGHPATAICVFSLIVAPLCATIVVGIDSVPAHSLPLALSAEFGPLGKLNEKLAIGTSGTLANVELVTPPLIFVLPTKMKRTPWSPSNTMSKSGNAAPPCETRYAVPVNASGSTGVCTLALPTIAAWQLAAASAAKAASPHAFCNVLKRATNCLGNVTDTD
jgi:hypothetical protein